MSEEKLLAEAQRWFAQAQDDLEAASFLHKHGKYAQACFFCQQAAEKAAKALWLVFDVEPWGHSVTRLFKEFPDSRIANRLRELLPNAQTLDRFYIPTRYPNAIPDITPAEAFGEADAAKALHLADEILQAVENLLESKEARSR